MKFKQGETPDIFYKIDGEQKISFLKNSKPKTSGAGYYKEMLVWVADGNKIEPQFTPEELTEKEKADLKNVLESQQSTCIALLNDSDKKMVIDNPNPIDVDKWRVYRAKLRRIFKSDKLETIPEKPFS